MKINLAINQKSPRVLLVALLKLGCKYWIFVSFAKCAHRTFKTIYPSLYTFWICAQKVFGCTGMAAQSRALIRNEVKNFQSFSGYSNFLSSQTLKTLLSNLKVRHTPGSSSRQL